MDLRNFEIKNEMKKRAKPSVLLNSKIALYLPPPPCLDVCSSSGKEVIKIM
jgi:hypothetical protein